MALLTSSWSTSLAFVGRAIGGYTVASSVLGVAAVLSALLAPDSIWTDVLLWVAIAWSLAIPVVEEIRTIRGRPEAGTLQLGLTGLPRILATLAALAVIIHRGGSVWGIVAGALVCLLIIGEQAMRRPIRAAMPQVANLPGREVPLPSIELANWFFRVNTLGVVLVAAAASFAFSSVFALVCVVPGIVLAVLLTMQAARYLVRRNQLEKDLPKILRELGPVFAFHWHAPVGTAYQASMWLPYLARLGVPYFVLVRTVGNFNEVAKLTDAPVILRVGLEDLDPILCPSLKVVFYANTAVRNSHMIRFPHLTHIQLNHGDSDKIASVSPTFRQYDKNFVAGQAAIDRFEKHGVATRSDSFVIVGRPQLEDVELGTGPISAIETPTVLYSPTWSGFYDDSDYSSLPVGRAIVEALVGRGCTVVFRPHPYARRHKANAQACSEIIDLLTQDVRTTGRPHVFGAPAETDMSVVDCFNASDAMISDVSSVVSDYLISRKPFAMAAVSAHGQDFIDEFPLGEAAYIIDVRNGVVSGLEEALDALLGADPKSAKRQELRAYYIGELGPRECVQHFIDQARAFLV